MPLDLSSFEPLLDKLQAEKFAGHVPVLPKGYSLGDLVDRIPYDEWLDRHGLNPRNLTPPRSKETPMSKWKRREHAGWRSMSSDDILLTKKDPHDYSTTDVHVLEAETRAALPAEPSVRLDGPVSIAYNVALRLGPGGMAQDTITLPVWVFKQLYERVPDKVAVMLEVEECEQLLNALRPPPGYAGTPRKTPRIIAALEDAIAPGETL